MPNRLLTTKEVGQIVLDAMKKFCGDDIKKQRAFVYDMQTAFGGFPSSKEQRDKYITIGHT